MIKLIAFDFDGTLADSVDFCLLVFEKVFAKYMGEKAPGREDIYQNFGMNEPGVLRFFMGHDNPEAEADFYRIHRELHPEMCPEVYPGCRELLEFIRSRNVEQMILTGRSETTCSISMEYLQLSDYFSAFQTGSPEKNDKSGQLCKIMEERGLKRDEIIYIGDAVSDAEACIKAGVTCLTAAWAKSARIPELEKINPGLVFKSVADMKKYLEARI